MNQPPAFDRIALYVHPDGAQLAPDGGVELRAPDDPTSPIAVVQDGAAFRLVFAPPGSEWELKPKKAPLWTPGQR